MGSSRERIGRQSTATHGRRIALYVVLLATCVAGSIWLFTDPAGSNSGTRGYGLALAPVGVLLMAWGLVRELQTGDTRDWRPLEPLLRRLRARRVK
jgi:hypothetical protein